MKTINLNDLRTAVADTMLTGHTTSKEGVLRQDTAKVGKRGSGPQRD